MARLKGLPGFDRPYGLSRAGASPTPPNPYPGAPSARLAPDRPVILEAGLLLQPNASGSPNALALKNQTGRPIEIDEIHFRLAFTWNVFNALTMDHIVDINLGLNNSPITNGFVPLASICRSPSPWLPTQFDLGFPAPAPGLPPIDFCSYYRWKLPRPLWLDVGETLLPAFRHRGLLAVAVNIDMTYVGRTVSGRPKRVDVPYVTAFISNSFPMDGGFAEQMNEETSLANPFSVPLNIERFIGRELIGLSVAAPGAAMQFADVSSLFDATGIIPGAIAGPAMTIQIDEFVVKLVNSHGDPVIREFMPLLSVVELDTGSIELPHVLPPEMYYRLWLQTAGGVVDPDGWKQLRFSMVGWRREELK